MSGEKLGSMQVWVSLISLAKGWVLVHLKSVVTCSSSKGSVPHRRAYSTTPHDQMSTCRADRCQYSQVSSLPSFLSPSLPPGRRTVSQRWPREQRSWGSRRRSAGTLRPDQENFRNSPSWPGKLQELLFLARKLSGTLHSNQLNIRNLPSWPGKHQELSILAS